MEALRAQQILADDFGVAADVYSATSYQLLRTDCAAVERWNRLHPTQKARTSYLEEIVASGEGPIVAVSDFLKTVPDLVGRYVDGPFMPLGTEGFGRSDLREKLRRHFEIDAEHIVVATLASLAQIKKVPAKKVKDAIAKFGIDPDQIDPYLA